MKKTLITLAVAVALVGSAFGQGQVLLANNAGSLVRLDNAVSGTPVVTGTTSFQLYFGASSSSLTPLSPVVGTSPTLAGRIANTAIDVGSPGTTFFFQIYGWQGGASSYDLAVGQYRGFSTIFSATTSANATPPPTAPSLAGLYPGFALVIPEPTTYALLGLGAASLFLFRRRK